MVATVQRRDRRLSLSHGITAMHLPSTRPKETMHGCSVGLPLFHNTRAPFWALHRTPLPTSYNACTCGISRTTPHGNGPNPAALTPPPAQPQPASLLAPYRRTCPLLRPPLIPAWQYPTLCPASALLTTTCASAATAQQLHRWHPAALLTCSVPSRSPSHPQYFPKASTRLCHPCCTEALLKAPSRPYPNNKCQVLFVPPSAQQPKTW